MLIRTAAALLGAASAVLAIPTVEERGEPTPPNNSSIEAIPNKGFEVVIVYAQPDQGCPASPAQCDSDPFHSYKPDAVEAPSPSSSFVHDGPTETLAPAVHWECDTRPAENVIPIPIGKGSDMYYGVSDPSQAGHFAHLTYYFKKPSVNLDHCDHTKVVEYSSDGLTVKFLTREAYDYALKTWVAKEEIILITYTKGCGDYEKGDRCYFKVSALDFKKGSLSIVAQGKPCHPDDIIESGETEWGWWIPKHGGKSSLTASQTSTSTGGASFSWAPSSSSSYGFATTLTATTSRPGATGTHVFSSGGASASGSGFAYPSGSSLPGASGGASGGPSSGAASGGSGASSTSGAAHSSATGGASFSSGGASFSSRASASSIASSAQPSASGDSAGFSASKGSCVPPVDEKYNLPTACWGDLFDQDLDEELGWEPTSEEYMSFITSIAPGIDESYVPDDAESYDDFVLRRGIQRRCSICKAFVKHVVKPVAAGLAKVQDTLSISGSVNKEVSWKIPDPSGSNAEAKKLKDPNAKQVTSPWGDSILLKAFGTQTADDSKALNSYMNVFCVGCGVSGSAKLAGRAKWTPIGGFLEGVVEVNTDVQFVFKLGIDAQMTYKKEFNSDLFNVGLPGLSYGVVTIGPRITVGSRVSLEAEAKGKLLAGAEMGLQNAQIKIDFVNPSKTSKQGWDPYFKPVFEAEGELMLAASLGLPIGLKCGLQIASWDKSVGIIDEPSIKGVAQVAASIGLTQNNAFSAGFKETDGCTGIATQLSWRNKLYIDIFGTKQIPLLDTQDKILTRGCIPLPAKPAEPTKPEGETPEGEGSEGGNNDGGSAEGGNSEGGNSEGGNSEGGNSEGGNNDGGNNEGSNETPDADAGNTEPNPDQASDAEGSANSEPARRRALRVRQDPQSVSVVSASASALPSASGSASASILPSAPVSQPSSSPSVAPIVVPPSGSDKIVDLTSKIKSTNGSSELSYTTTPLPNRPYNDTRGYEYALLVDPTATVMIVSCSNGNLYSFAVNGTDNPSCSEMWATHDDVLVSDGSQRLAHYYNNTMSALGVSRLRVEDEADIPVGGVVVGFAPYGEDGSYEDGSYFYIAVDPAEEIFYLMVCEYEEANMGAKLFLARDPEEGREVLKSEDVRYTVTGGKVKDCWPIMLVQGEYAAGDDWMGYSEAEDSAGWDLEEGWDLE
ncbi:hypothetical protein OQA88_5588 [Cercophora sp. LCS_1]